MKAAAPLISAALALALGACSFSFPVVGRTSDGLAMQGETTANMGSDPGTFTVSAPNGFTCSGTYDDDSYDITFDIPVACSDGRTGTVVVTRDASLVKGTAIAELNDGTRAEFLFGDISAEQQGAFLSGPAQAPEPAETSGL